MPNEIQSSFIPKQSLTKTILRRPEPISLMMMLALFILGASLLLWGVAWGYRYLLLKEIITPCPHAGQTNNDGCGLAASLEGERERLNYDSLRELQRADAKNKLAVSILNNHIDMVPVFNLLNESALKTVQYKKFSYDQNKIIVDGVAANFKEVAVQSQVLDAPEYRKIIQSPIFSDFSLDQKGNVGFRITFTVDPSLVSYSQSLNVVAPPTGSSTPATP